MAICRDYTSLIALINQPGLCAAGVVSDLRTSASEFTDPLATSTPDEAKSITPPPMPITADEA